MNNLSKQADGVLKESELLRDLDLEVEEDAHKAMDRLEGYRESPEWWALILGASIGDLRDRIESQEVHEAVIAALRIQAARAMLVFKQDLEEHIWTGYSHTSVIYEIASSSARTPQEAEQIRALRPLFSKLEEDVLHAWVGANVAIGPRIGVRNVDEELLRSLAQYHLSLFDQRREERQQKQENQSRVWANRVAAAGATALFMTALVAILKATGVL